MQYVSYLLGGIVGKNKIWTPEMDAKLLEMRDARWSLRAMGHKLGCSHHAVARRLERLGTPLQKSLRSHGKPTVEPVSPPAEPTFLRQRQAQVRQIKGHRRGAVLPPELEQPYTDLLKQGLSIHEALKRLGITPNQPNRGAP